MKAEARTPINDSAWNGLKTRCFTIIARIRCAEAQPVPPRPFCCHITYEVMTDPVVTKYGYIYERNNIVRHIREHNTDPLVGLPLTVSDLAPNFSLKDAIEYYNMHFMRFSVPLYTRRRAAP
eukprot:gene27199-2447_t